MRLLIVDTETTGLDPKVDKVIELGFALYSVPLRTTLLQFSTLLRADENPAEFVNRIPIAACLEMHEGYSLMVMQQFLPLAAQAADLVVAHNAAFDSAFIGHHIEGLPWVCTKEDFEWPEVGRPHPKLVEVALSFDLGVASAHRALTDVQLLCRVFDKVPDLEARIARAMRPKQWWRAIVSYDNKELAKVKGFGWYPDRKMWLRRMPAEDAQAITEFQVREVEAP